MNSLLITFESKKGIPPILATLLLIFIAVAAVIVTYAWLITFTGSNTQQTGVLLVKENVSWPSTSTISVVIKNVGTSNAKIMAVYMGTSSANLNLSISASPTPGGTSAIVNAGASTTFTITHTWNANTTYHFKFSTDTPVNLEFSEESP